MCVEAGFTFHGSVGPYKRPLKEKKKKTFKPNVQSDLNDQWENL